jgi:hypothetical protein
MGRGGGTLATTHPADAALGHPLSGLRRKEG